MTAAAARKNPNAAIYKRLQALAKQREAIDAEMCAVCDKLVCEVCGSHDDVAVRRVALDKPICQHCLYVWHDCGLVDTDDIRNKSLEIQVEILRRKAP